MQWLLARFFLLCFGLSSAHIMAVQPLDEVGLEGVSADAGVNILNLYGATAAGIALDAAPDGGDELRGLASQVSLDQTRHSEATEAQPAAEQQLSDLEQSLQTLTRDQELGSVLSSQEVSSLLNANSLTLGQANVLRNSSEIRYRDANFNRELQTLDEDSVNLNRDLLIERLSIENLSGNDTETSRSAGSIFISDWRSRGATRIQAE